jgi:hypothetical protein
MTFTMKTHNPLSIAILAFILLPTGPTVFAAPAAVPDPIIAYHTLPTATPVMTDDNSYDKISARIRSLVPFFGKRAAIPGTEHDWKKWHTQWKRRVPPHKHAMGIVLLRVLRETRCPLEFPSLLFA